MNTSYHTNKFCQQRSLKEVKKLSNSLSPLNRSLFGILLSNQRANNGRPVYQGYIAKKLGVTRETVNRGIRELCDLGLMGKQWFYKKACLYFFDPYFLTPVKGKIAQLHAIYENSLQHANVTLSSSYLLTYLNIILDRKTRKHFSSQARSRLETVRTFRNFLPQTMMLTSLQL